MMPASDYSWLRDQLTTIARDVADVKTDVASIKAGSSQCEKSIADLERTVFGNGKDGLKTTIQKQSSEIVAIRTDIRRDHRWIGKIACVVGWLVTACCLAYQTFK
jgi:hypothetical protein